MISIIIPVYNQTEKLDKCLESIKDQTYSNYEIIVVNDRSTSRMSYVMEKYKSEFGYRIVFYHNQTNHGASYSRNKGFRRSKGEFVIFCDADVIMKPEMLNTMHKTLKDNPFASYAYSSFKYGFKKFKLFKFDEKKLRHMPYIHTTSLIRRECFPIFDEELKRLQDWDLWLTMLKNGDKGIWIDKILFTVQPGGNISTWLPSISYKLCPFLPKVIEYKSAVKIIKEKHGL